MTTQRIGATEFDPISLAEARLHCREPELTKDAELLMFIAAATAHAEAKTGRAICTATYETVIDYFPRWTIANGGDYCYLLGQVPLICTYAPIELPYPPLQSVEWIKYIDTDGAEQTLAEDQYEVVLSGKLGSVRVVSGGSWPSTRYTANAVTIRYKAGYASKAAIPDPIKHWIKCAIYAMDDNRILMQEQQLNVVSMLDSLLDPYKVDLA